MINRDDKILVTGGKGFIGTNLLEMLKIYNFRNVVVADAETYASRPWLSEIYFNYEKIDIRDQAAVTKLMRKYRPDHVLNLAAESHVCRSIAGPKDFITTNVNGTWNLLQEFLETHSANPKNKFIQISTDEVFGELEDSSPKFTAQSAIQPRSPYASSKAAADGIALSYWHTYGLPVVVTHCSNNYGENQHEEKLIPRTIKKIMNDEPITIYGSGDQVRDWIHVKDHCLGIMAALDHAAPGTRQMFGGNKELRNKQVVEMLIEAVNSLLPYKKQAQVIHTNDRPTDDHRYAIDFTSTTKDLGWSPQFEFEKMMYRTVEWYILNSAGARVDQPVGRSKDGEVKWM